MMKIEIEEIAKEKLKEGDYILMELKREREWHPVEKFQAIGQIVLINKTFLHQHKVFHIDFMKYGEFKKLDEQMKRKIKRVSITK